MPIYFTKSKEQLLRHALNNLVKTTDITSTAPGSIARGLTEVFTDEVGELYAILDFNITQSVLSTAAGRSLDLMGQLYNVRRRQLSDLATVDAAQGAFMFYLDSPHNADISIPRGTRVSTGVNDVLGATFVYLTTEETVIRAGRLKAYASIRPLFEDSIYTAGVNTLVSHNIVDPPVVIKATNPKPIQATVGYESDDSYRSRIIAGVRTAAGGTEPALRFTGLSIPGVRDIRVRHATFGLSTCEIIVVPEDARDTANLIESVRTALVPVTPVGTRLVVHGPTLLRVDLKANVATRVTVGQNVTAVARRVENAILRYLNSLLVGEQLIYNRLISYVLDAAEAITDVSITSLTVNGQAVLRNNYSPKENEHLVPGTIEIRIA